MIATGPLVLIRHECMRRVVITGMGIVSCIGNGSGDVLVALRESRCGIRRNEEYFKNGLRSLVSGSVELDTESLIDRKVRRFMGPAAAYAYIAMRDAIADAQLADHDVSNLRTGLIASAGGVSSSNIIVSTDIARTRGVKKVGPYMVPRTMGSSVAACLATSYRVKGVSYGVTSACATSAEIIV